MKTGIRGIIRDIFLIYVCIRLLGVWLFGAEFTFGLGIMVVIMFLISVWFMAERIFLRG